MDFEPEKSESVLTLRIGKELHECLRQAAAHDKMSMNQFCAMHLKHAIVKHIATNAKSSNFEIME